MTEVVWRPHPGPQAALVSCPIEEICYGGARGGGKTAGMLGKNAIKADRYGKDQKGIFFRKQLPQLEDAIEEAKKIYIPLGWKWGEQKRIFTAPNGATLKFRALEKDIDIEKYRGHGYTDAYFEELTDYPNSGPYNKMRGSLRSATVPVQMHSTCNPGGVGHHWVRARFIDPNPNGYEVIEEEFTDPFSGKVRKAQRIFIPAKLSDNPVLLEGDPMYVVRLQQSGSEAQVRAWLHGDWNQIEGAYFDCWDNQKIVIPPFVIPADWARFRSFDWGSAKPFSVGWWAVAGDDISVHGKEIKRGALIRYREWYGAKEPDVGLKLTAEEVRDGIIERSQGESYRGCVADPAIFAHDGGPSIAERMRPVNFRPADNKRVARVGQAGGWDQMRARMRDEMIFCFDTCKDSIRTIPMLQHDPNRPEDVQTESEDHAADEWRYACMSRMRGVKPTYEKNIIVTDIWGRMKQPDSWKVA